MNKSNWFTAASLLLPTLGIAYMGLIESMGYGDAFRATLSFIAAGGLLLAIPGSLLAPRSVPLILLFVGHLIAGAALAAQFVRDWSDTDTMTLAYGVQTVGQLVAGWYSLQWWLSGDGRGLMRNLRAGLALSAIGFALQAGFAYLDEAAQYRPLFAIGAGLATLGLALCALFLKGIEPMTIHLDVRRSDQQGPPSTD